MSWPTWVEFEAEMRGLRQQWESRWENQQRQAREIARLQGDLAKLEAENRELQNGIDGGSKRGSATPMTTFIA